MIISKINEFGLYSCYALANRSITQRCFYGIHLSDEYDFEIC